MSSTLKGLINSGLETLRGKIKNIKTKSSENNNAVENTIKNFITPVKNKVITIKEDLEKLKTKITDLNNLLASDEIPDNLGTVNIESINTAIGELTGDVEELADIVGVDEGLPSPPSTPPGFPPSGGYIVPQLRSRSKRVQFRSHRPRHKKHTKKKGKRHKKKKPRRTRRT